MHYLKVAANQVYTAKNLSNIWELASKFIRHIVLDKKWCVCHLFASHVVSCEGLSLIRKYKVVRDVKLQIILLKAIQDKKVVHNFERLKKAAFCQLMSVGLAWKSADKK